MTRSGGWWVEQALKALLLQHLTHQRALDLAGEIVADLDPELALGIGVTRQVLGGEPLRQACLELLAHRLGKLLLHGLIGLGGDAADHRLPRLPFGRQIGGELCPFLFPYLGSVAKFAFVSPW